MAAKIAPPATVAGASLAGISISEWVLWATLIYTLLMIAHKLWKMGIEAREFWLRRK